MALFFVDKECIDIDYSNSPLEKGEYDNCTFNKCNFSDTDLSAITFLECQFIECNFSMATLHGTALNDVTFKTCKLLGVGFNNCSNYMFKVHFEACNLKLASFYKLSLKGINFKKCNLEEVDFIEADLTEASFDYCNLNRTIFERTTLEKADFRTSTNFSINPALNKMTKAKFSKDSLNGLLNVYKLDIS